MKKATELLSNILNENLLVSATISAVRIKNSELKSIKLYPLKESHKIKVEFKYEKHNNIVTLSYEQFIAEFTQVLAPQFKQILIKTNQDEYQILFSKELKSKIIHKSLSVTQSKSSEHNRKKSYIIPDKKVCPFLIEIGVMDKRGHVKTNYYKKFRQINRFLEMVDDLFKNESQDHFNIVDFGCGKSYLTFALYFYFTEIKSSTVSITGIDLKQEVIDHCNLMSGRLNYKGLNFVHGFIHDFTESLEMKEIDFVVTLHACDTATDDAILFSIKHQAQKMIFVPCCQHELNKQLTNQKSNPLLKHGILRERLTSLVTDSMRSLLLEYAGYKVQCMEFIDLEHTAKNMALRCTQVSRSPTQKEQILAQYQDFKSEWSIEPYLEKELKKLF